MNRGILVTAYANLAGDVSSDKVKEAYEKYYEKEQFIRIVKDGTPVETRWVEGSNYTDISFKIDERTKRIIVMGTLDNVVKGAAGQAVQNMNLMFGFAENEGLTMVPIFPA